jgi:protein-S-isoprenylcysteine O-methyltransferase Ste14
MGPFMDFCIGDPFFWAVVGMFALIGSSVTLVSKDLRRHKGLNIGFVLLFGLARFMIPLPLPCSEQPRFDLGSLNAVIGIPLLICGIVFLSAVFVIRPWPKPCEETRLVTDGLYSVVRNPIYLGELMWSLGWAVLWGSTTGVLLVPLWYAGFLLFVMLEEEDLEDCLGEPYKQYKSRVNGRILPRVRR